MPSTRSPQIGGEVDLILDLAAGDHIHIGGANFGRVGRKKALLSDRRVAASYQFFVQAITVLMPAQPFLGWRLSCRQRRGDNQMRMVELNVPTQNTPHLGQRLGPVEQLDKGVIFAHKIEDILRDISVTPFQAPRSAASRRSVAAVGLDHRLR